MSLAVGELVGLSGLAPGERGAFWVVPERQRLVAAISIDRSPPGLLAAPLPLIGVPDDADTEAIASLGEGRFALGTERPGGGRPSDTILFARLEGGALRVERSLELSYAPWGITAESNRGIEGLCAAGDTLLAGVETRIVDGHGGYQAPLLRIHLPSGAQRALRLPLSGREGALSALACRPEPGGGLEVLAVQRNRQATFLLGLVLPAALEGEPELRFQLDLKSADPGLPNLEGVAFLGERRALLVSDNHYGVVTGPSEAVLVDLPAP